MRGAPACPAFPRGLVQPEGSFRFAADALLLASFVRPWDATGETGTLLDLGTGCGVVALGVLLRCPNLRAVGLDLSPELLAAAGQNAVLLDCAARFTTLCADVRDIARDGLGRDGRGFDRVTLNPPYRDPGRGRLPRSETRRTALFGDRTLLAAFLAAGRKMLAEDGLFSLVFPLERTTELEELLAEQGLFPLRVRPVRFRERGGRKGLALLEAGKTDHDVLIREEPLLLHADRDGETALTPEVLAFCPWLCKDSGKMTGIHAGPK